MSDSESDLLPSNVFTFQNENTTVSAKGPNITSANYTNLSFRNNVMTSTMHMSRNFGRHHYGEPRFDQRSMNYRRETSPMSLYSGSDMRGRNQSHYHGGMSSQRSMYNGRSGSPMSMRSMDSNASVSAVDIALAFKNVKFNKYDLRMIKEAYNKFMKRSIRKKIEKRRNMRLFLKGYRRKSGYDSGEQGSDSSISSEECKSTNSAMYKDNMSSCRSTRTDLTDFRHKIKESNMYKDCSENFKQNAMKNLLSVTPANARDRFLAPPPTSTVLNQQSFTQKDRFKNGFLLPSQRFNKSVASHPIYERDQGSQNILKPKNHTNNGYRNTQERVCNETDSDQEEIFSEITVKDKNIQSKHQLDKIADHGKRNLETKLSSPVKQQKVNGSIKDRLVTQPNTKTSKSTKACTEPSGDNNSKKSTDAKKNDRDFEFIKPQLPVKKSGPGKIKEKLISKSAPPLIDTIIPQSTAQSEITGAIAPATVTSVNEEKKTTSEEQPDTTQHSNSDLSLRPSFIKRKLFSQKMDVTERKNMSNDAVNVNSPQTNVYSAIQKEKHKARKLVTNQSCLSRDVVKEDNNLLDLIHKIVPPDRMNVTNKTSIGTNISSKNNAVDDEDKWDVTSVISTCNNDNVSDTYTDEEIFEMDEKKKSSNKKVVKNNTNVNKEKKVKNCKVLAEKLPKNVITSTKPRVEPNKTIGPQEENDNPKKSVYNYVKSFWDTDLESDVESPMPNRLTSAVKENQISVKENHGKSIIVEAVKPIKSKNIQNHNISLASVSESIKSKTVPTNNMGNLKLNISKQLNIKSFLSPKHKQSKVKEQKGEKVEQQKVDCIPSNTESDVNKKESNKQTRTSKSANNVSRGTNNKVKKPNNVDNATTNKKTPPTNKTKNNRTPQSSEKANIINKTAKSPNKNKANKKVTKTSTKNNVKLTQPTNKTKNNKPVQSPNQSKNKTDNPQYTNLANKTVANRSISARTVRTPKRKACCGEPLDHDSPTKPVSPVTNTNGPPNKKPKLVDTNLAKGKVAKKTNDNAIENKRNNSSKNVKKAEPATDVSIVYAGETSNRTLRPRRKIDLSTSINSSTENLNLRSLRTRRVDLSSSLRNSSLDENILILKNPRSKANAKKTGAKPGHAELLDKRQRR